MAEKMKAEAKRRRTRRAVLALLAVLAAVATATPGEAGTESASPDGAVLVGEVPERPARPVHRGLDGQVSVLVDEWLEQQRGGVPDGGTPVPAEVDVVVLASRSRGSAATALVSASGGTGISRHGDTVYATLPIGVLIALGQEDSVVSIHASPVGMPQATTGQGVGFVNADEWHSAGFTGAGVKVAVIDGGFEGYLPLLGDELPAAVTVGDWGCGGDVQNGETHGTGVAEIVHEVAPDADLYLLCFDAVNDLASAVNYAVVEGIDVINLSYGYFNAGRGDGSGATGPIIQTAHDAGILFVASAGNSAQEHWMGTFSDSNASGWHNFAALDETIQFTLASGQGVAAFLKWDDWSSPTNDYDIYLFREPDFSTPVAWSENFQQGNPWETPREGFLYINGGSPATYHLAFYRFSGAGSPTMDLFLLGVAKPIDYNIVTRSVLDPATSPLVTAIGAVCWGTDAIKPYSSQGPNINGLLKPDLSGPAGVSGATYGATGDCNGGFKGTSASSPHVAGAAALLAQAYPAATKTELHNMLLSLTRDAGAAGPDTVYGTGILDLGEPPFGDQATPTVGLVDPSQGRWHLRNSHGDVTSFFFGNPGDIPFVGDWDCDGVETPGLYRQSDGFAYLRNSNTQGNADITFFFGNPGDVPIAADFNGNGCETVSIYRPSNQTFYIINQLGQNGGGLGAADFAYVFGNPGDKPFVGDFDGDQQDTVGLHRESTGFVYFRNSHTQGNADAQFFFGNPGDRFVAGDWNGNSIDSPGIFRPGNTTFYFRFTNTQGNADAQLTWGEPDWMPVAGDFGLG